MNIVKTLCHINSMQNGNFEQIFNFFCIIQDLRLGHGISFDLKGKMTQMFKGFLLIFFIFYFILFILFFGDRSQHLVAVYPQALLMPPQTN